MRLGILASHPIQYQAPWFRALARQVDLHVFFAHQPSAAEQGSGFGKAFAWDVDLLSGYPHTFLKNVAQRPDVSRYDGCDNPEIAEIIRSGCKSKIPHSAFRVPRSFDAFIVTGWYLKCYRQAMRACRRAGVPVLVRGDSQLGTPRSLVKRLALELRQRWLLRQFDGFLSVGQRHTEYLRHFGVPARKIFFAPHFVDHERFARMAKEAGVQRSEIRRQWGAGDATLVALFVGKFQSVKRPLDLLSAVASLPPTEAQDKVRGKVPALLPVFIGSGELGPQLREACHVVCDAENPHSQLSEFQLSAFQTKPPACFPGFKNQSELPACYAAADVLVLPSESETWGLVVNEAMACGLPAIVSAAVGCAPDLIEEGRTGFTYPMGDIVALADRLHRMAEMKRAGHDWPPALAAKMETYQVERVVAGTIEAVRATTSQLGTSADQ